jgi:hydroxymethylpyrimidine/phosphomethylpyrimidine kinase
VTTAIAVTIAGSDSGGGAGIQADLKTFSALGVYGASVVAALTAQNTKGVTAIHDVPADFITAQIDAVFADLHPNAVKIGMLGNAAAIEAVAKGLEHHHAPNIVLDPVMIATSGDQLLRDDAIDALRKLMAKANVVTPNLPEAAALLGRPVAADEDEMRRQAEQLLALGAGAVLIKGGHGSGPSVRRRDVHPLCGAAHRDQEHPRHRLYAVVGHRRGTGEEAPPDRCGQRRQGLCQRGDRRGRPAQDRHRPRI